MPAGRPKIWVGEKLEKAKEGIIEQLSLGVPMGTIAKQEGMPSIMQIWRMERDDEKFREDVARASEQGTNMMAAQCIEIADDPDIDPKNKRVMVDTRLKLIGKWNRKIYGDKLDQQIEGNVTYQIATGVPERAPEPEIGDPDDDEAE